MGLTTRAAGGGNKSDAGLKAPGPETKELGRRKRTTTGVPTHSTLDLVPRTGKKIKRRDGGRRLGSGD